MGDDDDASAARVMVQGAACGDEDDDAADDSAGWSARVSTRDMLQDGDNALPWKKNLHECKGFGGSSAACMGLYLQTQPREKISAFSRG